MIVLTLHELTGLVVGLAVTLVAVVFVDVAYGWRQEQNLRRLNGDLNEVWAWCDAAAQALGWTDDDDHNGGDGGDPPPPDLPDPLPPGDQLDDTVISHPADTYARKAALLDRYAHIGQHRT